MQINTGTFYKAKDTVNGMKKPGGYFYVMEAAAGKVKCIVTENKTLPKESGIFTLSAIDFERLVEQ